MNVSAAYKIEKSPKGFKAVRQGEIEVIPPDFVPGSGQQLDAQRQIIRKLLKKRFAKVFEPEFLGKGLELSGKWKAAGKLMPIQVVCRDGWLVIAWSEPPPSRRSLLPSEVIERNSFRSQQRVNGARLGCRQLGEAEAGGRHGRGGAVQIVDRRGTGRTHVAGHV